MSLGTIILVVLAALFFGGIAVLARTSKAQSPQEKAGGTAPLVSTTPPNAASDKATMEKAATKTGAAQKARRGGV